MLDSLSEGEEAARWRGLVPRFEYLLDDLTAEREEALRARPGPPLVRLALLLLRYGRAEELTWRLEGWRALVAELNATPEGLEELRAVVHYLVAVENQGARSAFQRVLKSVVGEPRAEDLMKTIADGFREEGHQQGWLRGQARAVLRILAARGVAVDERTRQLILTCTDLASLDRWLDRAANATQLADLGINE